MRDSRALNFIEEEFVEEIKNIFKKEISQNRKYKFDYKHQLFSDLENRSMSVETRGTPDADCLVTITGFDAPLKRRSA